MSDRERADRTEQNRDISAGELKERIDTGERLVLLDVREPSEWERGRLPGATHLPLSRLGEAAELLDPDVETVVYCHHGSRSARAADWLRRSGFQRVRNLAGGIDRWSTEVDPTVPRY